jgi:serine/threonine protein phosphatase PrpC
MAMIQVFLQWLKNLLGIGEKKNVRPEHKRGTGMARLVTKKLDRRTQKLKPVPTVRLRLDDLMGEHSLSNPPASGTPKAPYLLRLEWFGLSDTGAVRDHNEDFFFCAGKEDTGLFVVADGMGGHDAGEVASRLAVETVCGSVREATEKENDPIELVSRSVLTANEAVIREGAKNGSNMGTTLGVALVAENTAYIASVGDSRVYWVENGSITQITEDHSLVAKLVAAGKLTREGARNHPKSNLLYRTIGSEDNVKVDTFTIELKKNGCLLLCTDGLWGEVNDEDIHQACAAEKDIRAACARLIRIANENGGKDNITAVMVRVK